MADNKPQKTLRIKRTFPETEIAADVEDKPAMVSKRAKKRTIKIAQPVKKKQQQQQVKKHKPRKPPSILRLIALDAELGKLSKSWRSHKPLTLGIEKQIFKAISDEKLSASKRVVRALLNKHCNNPNYLRNTVIGSRYDLTGNESGHVVASEAAYALKKLRALVD